MAKTAKINEVRIDPTAFVHPTAELDSGVEVGPYSIIGEGVTIGKNTKISSHVVIEKWSAIGCNNNIYQFVSIGAPPQDIGYKGEKTVAVIGDGNVFREFVTFHRATTKDQLKTVCGNNNMFMNYVHIAHDCIIGDNVIMANSATLGGHVTIDNNAIVGGIVAVHQHVRIGTYSMIGGASAVSKDIPPYVRAVGNRAHLFGLNTIGLKRQGFSKQDIEEIKKSYNIIFRSSMRLSDAIEVLKKELPGSVHAGRFIDFIRKSKRGITRERIKGKGEQEED